MSLKNNLREWTDWDSAAYILAKSLGILDEDVDFSTQAKHIFWSDNPTGTILHKMLNELVEYGFLEKRDEPDAEYDTQFRYNQSYIVD